MTRNVRFLFLVLPLTLALAIVVSVGCSKKPTDSELSTQVQKRLAADSALHNQPIVVSAHDGTVTLTGNVNGDGSRELAANDAAKVSGTQKVVNNLTVGSTGNAGEAAANSEPAQGPSTAPAAPASAPSAPAAPAQPQSVVVRAGARIRVRLGRTLSSKNSQAGEPFSGTLVDPVRVNGQTVIRAGARARGVVTEAKARGRFKGQAVLAIRLDSVTVDGHVYSVRTSHVERVEQGKGKRSAVMTGGGAGFGAIIGGLAGGGKGALIGGLVGGGGGAAGSAFTGNQDLVLPAESIVTFDLERSLTVTQ